MGKLRLGYLYTLSPMHPGGEANLGNILDIVRETHTNFPYLPGSSLRGCLRDEVKFSGEPEAEKIADRLFGKELDTSTGEMGIHQVWFGDARLLWVPMRTMAIEGKGDAFTWVSCHTLIRDHAILSGNIDDLSINFSNKPLGTQIGTYIVADSQIKVDNQEKLDTSKISSYSPKEWPNRLGKVVEKTWENNHIILPDDDFYVLMEHALWTQIRNKLSSEDSDPDVQSGSAEVFWTDICIPRDTIMYFPWGYRKSKTVSSEDRDARSTLESLIEGLFQVGGQANVGRGWVQGWTASDSL